MNAETKEIKEHVTSVFERLKTSHKLGLVIAVAVIGVFILASMFGHSHGVPAP